MQYAGGGYFENDLFHTGSEYSLNPCSVRRNVQSDDNDIVLNDGGTLTVTECLIRKWTPQSMYQKVLPVKRLNTNYLHIYKNNGCGNFYSDVALDTFKRANNISPRWKR